jgi:hypothetical protein
VDFTVIYIIMKRKIPVFFLEVTTSQYCVTSCALTFEMEAASIRAVVSCCKAIRLKGADVWIASAKGGIFK